MDTDNVLTKILSKKEIEKVPPDIIKKIQSHFTEKLEEFLTAKALCETAKSNIDEVKGSLERRNAELSEKIDEYSAKLKSSQQSVDELRNELETAKSEISKLNELVNKYEKETNEYRKERNDAIDERDSLHKMVERRNIEVERLQSDCLTLENQLQTAISAKCEALAKVDEIQSKEVSLDYKEKRMEQEKMLLNNTIKTLNDDLNRNINELATIRREHTLNILTLEAKLNEKTEELKIANNLNAHLTETKDALTVKAEDLATKLLNHNDEVSKMIDNYKKELTAKTKLADLYKEASEDNKNQIDELSAAVKELKKLLDDAADNYGELETKMKAQTMDHEHEIDEKNKEITNLKEELKNANDLLKSAQSENMEHFIENLAPTAAASSRLIKSGMTLTEIYSLYVKSTEELQYVKKENSRLNLQIQSILHELEEKAPLIRKQSIDHQNLVENNEMLSQQLENYLQERIESRTLLDETTAKLSYFERENKKLKTAQSDLSRQVLFLLKEIEQIRGGFSSEVDQSISSDMSADEVITKKLVTFSDIQELQENNQKLLLVVRDLSSKLEEFEQAQINMQQENYERKLENYAKKIKELENTQECQSKMLTTTMEQKERFKKLYQESCKIISKGNYTNTSMNGDDFTMEEDTPLASTSSVSSQKSDVEKEKKTLELEEKIKDLTENLKTLKEEYENYRKEKLTNEKMVNEQFDSMRNEIRELTSTNCKLLSASEYSSEQFKILQKNTAAYKKQIAALEERNKNYESTIVKHEQTIMYVKDEALAAQTKLSRYEVMIENYKQEIRVLKDSESHLKMEKEMLYRERQSQNILLNNLEMIKACFERSEAEGRQRVETRLDEATRECSALRRRLQEEQDRFRELSSHLQRQTESAKQKMKDEQIQADKLRIELKEARDEIENKSKHIDEISKKLQESLTPTLNDNPISQANKRAKEFELKYNQTKSDLESLEKELETCRENLNQYCTMAQNAEIEMKEMYTRFTEEKEKMDLELNRLRKVEVESKSRIDELETEISLQITGAQLSSGDVNSQLHKANLELQDTLQKLADNNRELREIRSQNSTLTASLQQAEHKYANEMIMHSSDIQTMTKLKDELNTITENVNKIKQERNDAIENLQLVKQKWEESEKQLRDERIFLEERIKDLDAQNSVLHNQIQSLSTKLSLSSSMNASIEVSTTKESGDVSMDVENVALMNRSLNEDDVKSAEQLLQIIKYLRKEKDIAMAKVDILQTETSRLQSEYSVLQTKLDEAISVLNNERSKNDIGIVNASKHSELLRKIETLNAVTDSNRILREERDTLSQKVNELSERITKCEDELYPLQEKNRELTVKSEATAAENASLRIEATRWRQRANLLVERSNKASPEDFKRLQTERENLAKMLTTEKENLKKSNDELNSIKIEKARLDQETQNLTKQLHNSIEENKKYVEEMNNLKQTNTRLTTEIMELKNTLLNKEDELKKISEELSNKDLQLADAKNKEVQIRKIAKRYKDSYFELKKQEEEKDGEKGEDETGESSIPKIDTEKMLQDKVSELSSLVTSTQEMNAKLSEENATLKANVERDEKNKQLLKDAKSRILSLTESKNTLSREIANARVHIQSVEQNRDELEMLMNGLKSQYETRISRLEATHSEQEKEKQDTIQRLTKENENLLVRVNQLSRQQGTKPSTSSSTTEKTTESLRTANVKPMAGPGAQQSATVTPWRGNETPLASIRPMSLQSSRTAAVLPTSQTSNVASVQGSGSATALVPPQQVHTTGNNSGEALSSSPTSSHTDYMPATSSAAVVVAAVPPLGSASTSAESSQEAESIQTQNNESPMSQLMVGGGQQQAVALVSPRVEGAQQNIIPPQSVEIPEQNQAPSTSGSSSSSAPVAMSSSHNQASSSNTVTTTQAGHKRPRDVEGDSSTGNNEDQDKQQHTKRARAQTGDTFQGVSESGLEVEYQVPTSSQRDQEDDIIVVDSEDDDDDGNAEVDDGPFEDDNGDGYDMEMFEHEPDMQNFDGDGPDIDEDNVQSDNNEVEIEDSSEVPNQSGTSSVSQGHVAPDAGTGTAVVGQSTSEVPIATPQNQLESQQIQTISSGSDAAGSSRRSQSQSSHLMLVQDGYEESGDDSIVPCTPTLYAQRRTDGFSEAVSSPHSQVPSAARFTFSEPRTLTGQSSVVPSDRVEESQHDTNEVDESGSLSNVDDTPKMETESLNEQISLDNQEPVAGPSNSAEGSVPEITITMTSGDEEDEGNEESATTSDVPEDERDKELGDESEEEDGEGVDGVSSEGEKAAGIMVEEGREAEATQTPSSNTRSRSTRGSSVQRRGGRQISQRGGRPTPIIWQDTSPRGGSGSRNVSMSHRNIESGSPARGQYQNQRSQRPRRMRRPSGPNFGNNMRY